MWISMPIPVTNNSQILDSGSSRNPASALNSTGPLADGNVSLPESSPSHVKATFSKFGCPLCVNCHTEPHAQRNASTTTPTQMALTAVFDSFLPKKNIDAAPMAGSRGMSQMLFKKNIFSSQFPVLSSH